MTNQEKSQALKKQKQDWIDRRAGGKSGVQVFNPHTPDTEAIAAYAKKVFNLEKEDNTGKILASIKKPEKVASTLSYEAAKKKLWALMKTFAEQFPDKAFVVDQYNKQLIQDLLKYFLGMEGNLDKTKGLFLTGATGLGKTVLMRIFSKFSQINGVLHKFHYYDATEIYRNYTQTQEMALEFYKGNNICIDDLGNEPLVYKHFGNEILPMVDLLYERHKRWERGAADSMTFITSNLSREEISERYGQRIADRFKMYNFVKLSGPSRR